ncbi:FAD-linked oxidoreductase-like protein [Infundibulicybe gibba]|nr:FAD-linked oxidoreductase-like protein [Infundibulicybe gibba]
MLKASPRLAKQHSLQVLHTSRKPGLVRPGARWYSDSGAQRFSRGVTRSRLGLISGGILLSLGVGLSPFYTSRLHADALATHQPLDTSLTSGSNDEPKTSLRSLIRSYVVYTMCSMPILIDNSPRVLEVLSSIPLVKQITEAFVRATFFDQFVGGDTALETVPLLHSLRSANTGAIFVYSVEVDEPEATASSSKYSTLGKPAHKRIVDEVVHCIDVAADFEDGIAGASNRSRKTWVAVKITALLPDARALANLSSHIISTRPELPQHVLFPGCPRPNDLDILDISLPQVGHASTSLSTGDVESLRELHADLVRICKRAQERGVKITIDAEYSWYQPALDALTLSLMRQFNRIPEPDQDVPHVQPLVYGTYQAYLRRTQQHLSQSIADAKAHNYALGVKLVRGAYHPHETAAHMARLTEGKSLSISPDPHPPVWSEKAETDRCYDACAKLLVQEIKDDLTLPHGKLRAPGIGALFGTHNHRSCDLILEELVRTGLAVGDLGSGSIKLGDEVTERITFGQLYGMSDELTDHLVQRTRASSPLVTKYVPYGALSEVMPYLGRRAIENKSVLGSGGAAAERRRAGSEIWRRIIG